MGSQGGGNLGQRPGSNTVQNTSVVFCRRGGGPRRYDWGIRNVGGQLMEQSRHRGNCI